MNQDSGLDGPVTVKRVVAIWWPLAASWLMMAFELPVVSAVIARLADPEIHLAAYGGVVFPISMLVEAPIIMLLAASTALSKDWDSYVRLRRFTAWLAGILTVVHILIAVTPLFDLIVGRIIQPPEAVQGPARIGLIIMTPWTASIAIRRFQQGVLIRFGHSKVVGVGTAVRLIANFSVLAAGYFLGGVSGIVVGATAVAAGVMAEAGFIAVSVRPVLKQLRLIEREGPPLSFARIHKFYAPLALTPLLALLTLPLVSSGLGRMPRPLESLATWPVVNSLFFALRSVGFAFNEVVVALLDRPNAPRALLRFSFLLSSATTVVLLILASTPLGRFYFGTLTNLEPTLARMGEQALWLGLLLPALSVFQSWFQGILVHRQETRAVSEAVALSLTAIFLILLAGVRNGSHTGLYVGVAAVAVGALFHVGWLGWRSRHQRRDLAQKSL